MPTLTKQQVVAAFRSSEILDAARKVFSKRGFRDATVDEIAEAAGLAKATVYQYFPSKQEIYLAAMRHGAMEMIEKTQREVDAAAGIRAKLTAFARTRLAYLEENREFFSVYNSQFGNLTHPASINDEFRNLYLHHLQFLEAVLRDSMQCGEIPHAPVEILATTLYEATRGLMLRRTLGWSQTTVEQEAAGLIEILWKGIAA